MKILLTSDSHGHTQHILDLVKMYPNCDLYMHAGDSEDIESALFPYETVKGNRDQYDITYERRIFNSPAGQILLTHYPDVILNKETKFHFHGHTHKRNVENENGIITVNPGAITNSFDVDGESYAVIEISKNQFQVKFFKLSDNKEIKSAVYKI